MKTYSTKQGDTWDIIARSQLGSEYHMHTLIALNFKYRDVLIFSNGTNLVLPEIEHNTAVDNEMIPPWKRNR